MKLCALVLALAALAQAASPALAQAPAPGRDGCSLSVARWQSAEPAGRAPNLDGYNRLQDDAVLAATLCEAGRPAEALHVLDGTGRRNP